MRYLLRTNVLDKVACSTEIWTSGGCVEVDTTQDARKFGDVLPQGIPLFLRTTGPRD